MLTTLLLYQNDFFVGKYISIERKIEQNKESYYVALEKSNMGWQDSTNDPMPFVNFILNILLAAYKDFGDRFSIVEEKLPAIDMVKKAAEYKIGRFTKQDIRELCPSLSISSIEGSLRKLVENGEFKREGVGKSTFYIRLK